MSGNQQQLPLELQGFGLLGDPRVWVEMVKTRELLGSALRSQPAEGAKKGGGRVGATVLVALMSSAGLVLWGLCMD